MRELYLSNPTDASFSELEGMSIRKILTNGGNAALTDRALLSISKILDLEQLDLEWATQITDQGLLCLAVVPTLTWVDLSFCTNITQHGVAKLRNAVPGLTVESNFALKPT